MSQEAALLHSQFADTPQFLCELGVGQRQVHPATQRERPNGCVAFVGCCQNIPRLKAALTARLRPSLSILRRSAHSVEAGPVTKTDKDLSFSQHISFTTHGLVLSIQPILFTNKLISSLNIM